MKLRDEIQQTLGEGALEEGFTRIPASAAVISSREVSIQLDPTPRCPTSSG